MKHIKAKFLNDIFVIIAGSFLFAMSINMFIVPGGIILGGATGFATIINRFTGLKIGTILILINIPLIILSLRRLGKAFLIKTAIGTLATSLAVNFLTFFPKPVDNPLLSSIFGGITIGASLGILFSKGYTTGGADILVFLLKRRFRQLSNGTLVLIIDVIVVTSSALILKNLDTIFYSAIIIYVQTLVMDFVMNGAKRSKMSIIISNEINQIAERISSDLDRGITILYGRGWYSGENREVILCVISPSQVYQMKKIVHSVDPNAFIIFTEASEVFGEGFIPHHEA